MEVAMPKYDFKCEVCSTVFEVTRSFGDSSLEPCPECGGATKRVFAPIGIVFKGSGFHNTDYRSRPKQDGSNDGVSTPKAAGSCTSGGSSACASCPAAES
jgi:putative FmdB family regulatory protein